MITIDTYKVKLPLEAIKYFKREAYTETIVRRAGSEPTTSYSINTPAIGIKRLEANRSLFIVEGSAKALLEDYHRGISLSTIERLVDSINSTGLVEFTPSNLLRYGDFSRIDIANNITVSAPLGEYVRALNTLRLNNSYRVDEYSRPNNTGIVFTGKYRSYKERWVAYNKLQELHRSANKAFIGKVGAGYAQEVFKGTLRVEQNIVNLRKIREKLDCNSTNVEEVLSSTSCPNRATLQKIKGGHTLKLPTNLDGLSLSAIETVLGRQEIIRRCNYDLELVKLFIREHVGAKTNIYPYLNNPQHGYKVLIQSMKNMEIEGLDIHEKRLAEIEEKLCLANSSKGGYLSYA